MEGAPSYWKVREGLSEEGTVEQRDRANTLGGCTAGRWSAVNGG